MSTDIHQQLEAYCAEKNFTPAAKCARHYEVFVLLGKSLRPLARSGQNPDFPYGVVFWVGREIPGALKRILEGRISRNSCRSAPEPALSVGFPGNCRSGPPACSGPVRSSPEGHHRRFGRGGSSGAMGRAFVMVLNCSISSW